MIKRVSLEQAAALAEQWLEAARIANVAGGTVVQKLGTATRPESSRERCR